MPVPGSLPPPTAPRKPARPLGSGIVVFEVRHTSSPNHTTENAPSRTNMSCGYQCSSGFSCNCPYLFVHLVNNCFSKMASVDNSCLSTRNADSEHVWTIITYSTQRTRVHRTTHLFLPHILFRSTVVVFLLARRLSFMWIQRWVMTSVTSTLSSLLPLLGRPLCFGYHTSLCLLVWTSPLP